MSIQRAEDLKREWTDRYVTVQDGTPELRRFEGLVGHVKTVNMNCRLLIEFDTPADISWYDIDPQFVLAVDEDEAKRISNASSSREAAPAKAAAVTKSPAAAKPATGGSPLDAIRAGGAAKSGTPAAAKPETGGSPLDAIRANSAGAIGAESTDSSTEKKTEPSETSDKTTGSSENTTKANFSTTVLNSLVSSGGKTNSDSSASNVANVDDGGQLSALEQVRQQAAADSTGFNHSGVQQTLFDQVKQQAAADDGTAARTTAASNSSTSPKHVAASSSEPISGVEDSVKQTFKGKKLPKLDDLKIIEGIGPKIEQLFNSDGIETWKQLSEADTNRLKKILEEAGPRFRMHKPETWPRQAELADQGKWQELEEYQDRLDGGRAPE